MTRGSTVTILHHLTGGRPHHENGIVFIEHVSNVH
jgi:hypothetical protein